MNQAQPGDVVHFLADGVSYSTRQYDPAGFSGVISRRGTELTLSEEIIAANTDRDGRSFFDLAGDDARQLDLYGRVLIGAGPWPAGAPTFIPGSLEWEGARETARQEAWKVPDEKGRREALAALQRNFGAAPATSRTTNVYRDPSAEENRDGTGDAYL